MWTTSIHIHELHMLSFTINQNSNITHMCGLNTEARYTHCISIWLHLHIATHIARLVVKNMIMYSPEVGRYMRPINNSWFIIQIDFGFAFAFDICMACFSFSYLSISYTLFEYVFCVCVCICVCQHIKTFIASQHFEIQSGKVSSAAEILRESSLMRAVRKRVRQFDLSLN